MPDADLAPASDATPPARPVVTRFAPSPTGLLHIGGARTALFNWLYARGRNGRFLLRIEDTDRARSTREATEEILHGLRWLGLDWDGDAVSQSARAARHAEVARELLARGAAYKCFSTPEEIEAFRAAARAAGRSTLFRSPWRDAAQADHPDAPHVLRLRAPRDGATGIEDAVQGRVTWQNAELDDMVLLRSDGSPTYMHAVVVDDHDMGVTHVIRGDDHLANAFRQKLVYEAMGWEVPVFAHIPLILGPDGKKLSKRHGATGVSEYQRVGYPATGMRNYLARLGWSHGDREVFTDADLIAAFDLSGINRSAARFDFAKLASISGQHIAMTPGSVLLADLVAWRAACGDAPLSALQHERLAAAMPFLKDRAKTLPDLQDKGRFALATRPVTLDEKAAGTLNAVSRGILRELTPQLQTASWTRDDLETLVGAFAEARGLKLGRIAQPLRAALSGRMATPSVFDMMTVLGRDETLGRLQDAAEGGEAG